MRFAKAVILWWKSSLMLPFVPNDVMLDKMKIFAVAIITGPNMAGKSTYMRQIALIDSDGPNWLFCSGCFGGIFLLQTAFLPV